MAKTQQQAVEFIENHAPDIRLPVAGDLADILRNLRSNVTSNAATELRPDGTSHVRFERKSGLTAGASEATLPAEIEIGIPILKGHLDENGAPAVYKLVLRVRAHVGDDAHLLLRFEMPQREIVMEQVIS